MKNLKLLIFNILNSLLLLFIVNLIIVSIYTFYYSYRTIQQFDPRIKLEVFQPHSWRFKYFEEAQQLKVSYTSYLGYKHKLFEGQTINIDNQGVRRTINKGIGKKKCFFMEGVLYGGLVYLTV